MNLAFENHLLFESLGWPDSESQSQQPTDGGSRRFFKRRVSLWTCHATVQFPVARENEPAGAADAAAWERAGVCDFVLR
jgi:hypothetical protein